MVSFTWDVALAMLCDKTNFRYCRFTGVIERNGCPGLQFGTYNPLYDLPFFVLTMIVTIFFLGFFSFLKPSKMKWKKQRPTRGVYYWQAHLVTCGLSVFFYGISVCITSKDGRQQRMCMAVRGYFQLAAALFLFWITFVDLHIIPAEPYWFMHIPALAIPLAVSFSWVGMYKNPTPAGLLTLGVLIPLGASFFHFCAMVPVCIRRKLWAAIGYCLLMLAFNIAGVFVETFGNPAICQGTTGILSGSAVSVLVYAFYRVFVQVFYTDLKKSEREDGLPLATARRTWGDPDDEEGKPFPVEFKDYSYSYTYSDG